MTEHQSLTPEQLILLQDKLCVAGTIAQEDFTALFGHINAVSADNEELTKLITTMAMELNNTANALKGIPTGTLVSHSWHDLAELVVQLKGRTIAAEHESNRLHAVEERLKWLATKIDRSKPVGEWYGNEVDAALNAQPR